MISTALLFMLSAAFHLAAAGRAPDVAPDLPAGWCDLEYGSPTRSTGECICSSNCQGSGCRTESGAIWFAYAECPTCQCVSSTVATKFSKAREENSQRQQQQEQQQERVERQKQQLEGLVEEEPEEVFDILDWIDDNLNYVIAGAVSMGVLYICMTIIGGAFSSEGRGDQRPKSSDSNRDNKSNVVGSDKDMADSEKTK